MPLEAFFQFLWRPRPKSFLSPEKEIEIFSNLKKFTEKYDNEDKQIMQAADTEVRDLESGSHGFGAVADALFVCCLFEALFIPEGNQSK